MISPLKWYDIRSLSACVCGWGACLLVSRKLSIITQYLQVDIENTIEGHLVRSLLESRLIQNVKDSQLNRCGRTGQTILSKKLSIITYSPAP